MSYVENNPGIYSYRISNQPLLRFNLLVNSSCFGDNWAVTLFFEETPDKKSSALVQHRPSRAHDFSFMGYLCENNKLLWT
jgi:hypothetical protein